MDNCIFCKILKGEIPSKKVYEDDLFYAFEDITPKAPVHVLIIPKEHINSMNEVEDFALIGKLIKTAREIAAMLGIAQDGYTLLNNCGLNGGQTVFHLHFHLLGGEKLTWF